MAYISWQTKMSLVLMDAIYRKVFIRIFTPTPSLNQKLDEYIKFVCKTTNL